MTLERSGRVLVYPNEIALETDILRTNMYFMTAVSILAQTLIGNGVSNSTTVGGLVCTPTGPPSLNVNISQGAIYQLADYDATPYSTIPADTTDMLYKQGINLGTFTFGTPFVVPGSGTNYYLIQAELTTTDVNSTNRPYFDSTNPTVPQFMSAADTRIDLVAFATKLSTVSTPAPDAGFVGLYAVTIPSGSTVITSGMISIYPGAPFINQSFANTMTYQNFQQSYPIFATAAGTANALTAAPAVPYATPLTGTRIYVKASASNTGATTINVSATGVVAIQVMGPSGLTACVGGEIVNGGIYLLTYTGTVWELLNPSNASLSYNDLQQLYPVFATAGGSANALTAAPAVPYAALVAGSRIYIQASASNTGATTLNVSSLGATTVQVMTAAGLAACIGGEIINGGNYLFVYTGTVWELMTPSSFTAIALNQPNIVGVSNASNAAAGSVGQLISSVIASGSPVSLSTGVSANVTSIALTAGDWDVMGNISFNWSITANNLILGAWTSLTSATAPDASLFNSDVVINSGVVTTFNSITAMDTPSFRVNVSTTTTVFLSCQATFTGTVTACGGIYARRRR